MTKLLVLTFLPALAACNGSYGGAPLALDVLSRAPLGEGGAGKLAALSAAADLSAATVMFSASYGIGGEAGQASGTVVARDGGFWFEPGRNPTSQLLLAPGESFDGGGGSSWELGAYLQLAGRVAASSLAHAGDGFDLYQDAKASLVSFTGGTAGKSVRYDDALEVALKSRNAAGVETETLVYAVPGKGPVALELREGGAVGGTFKVYVNLGN